MFRIPRVLLPVAIHPQESLKSSKIDCLGSNRSPSLTLLGLLVIVGKGTAVGRSRPRGEGLWLHLVGGKEMYTDFSAICQALSYTLSHLFPTTTV